jgi:FKBP-type peptidyl-prolyl cis-trans isomerase
MSKSLVLIITGVAILALIGYFIFSNNAVKSDEMKKQQSVNSQGAVTQQIQLKVEDLLKGSGKEVKKGDSVVIHYKGTLTDGSTFDSSYSRGTPFETQIGVGQVIRGWDEGVVGMKVGGKRRLTIPPELGYGNKAVGPIPANSTLIFDVELIDVK